MIGFLGGTFDPIHNGHLHAARTAAAALELERVDLVLAARPGHRTQPTASIEQRWTMLQLAVTTSDELLRPDDREIRRATASYTVETLEELRVELGARASLVWLLGWDAYRGLSTWRRWPELLSLSHLAVMRRPGSDGPLDETMRAYTRQHRVDDPRPLRRNAAGSVIFLSQPMLPTSSTQIREQLARGGDVHQLLPWSVWTYIETHHLYGGRPT